MGNHFADILHALEGGRWHSHASLDADNNGTKGADLRLSQIGLSADVVAHALAGDQFAPANLLTDVMTALASFKGDFNHEAVAGSFAQTPQDLGTKFSGFHAAQGSHFQGWFDNAPAGNDSTVHADAEAVLCAHQTHHLWG